MWNAAAATERNDFTASSSSAREPRNHPFGAEPRRNPMIDTHAHIHDSQYDSDREATIERARAAGVDTIVTVGCDLSDSKRALQTAETYGLLATIGIHPHEAKDAPDDIATAFDELRLTTAAKI